MFHFNHNWNYYGEKSKWTFKGGTDHYFYPERKCTTCSRIEQLEGVVDLPVEGLRKSWIQIYKSKYEADPLLDAVKKVYYAGTWSCPDVEHHIANEMWTELRDVAGFEPGGTSK